MARVDLLSAGQFPELGSGRVEYLCVHEIRVSRGIVQPAGPREDILQTAVVYLTVLRQTQRRFAMDADLGQYLAFDLARNLAAIFALDLARFSRLILLFHLADTEILAILWYFDLSLNHDQLHKWRFCSQEIISAQLLLFFKTQLELKIISVPLQHANFLFIIFQFV